MAVHFGTSGWSYDHWDGVLYPPGTPARDRLAHYVARLGTVELNASFHRWPRDAHFASWRLLQLHPAYQRDDARLDYLLGRLPEWMRVAVEFRHASWHDDAVYALLERHGAAYCVTSGAQLPCVLRATAPFVYVRMHGGHGHAVRNAERLRELVG